MTQNQGNQLGDRPCVRQSKLFRQHDAGNSMKDLMGQSHLNWKTEEQQGAYAGKKVFDHNAPTPAEAAAAAAATSAAPVAATPMATVPVNEAPKPQAKPVAGRRVGGYHNDPRDAGFNFFTGETKA